MALTPDQQRKRKKDIELLAHDWEVFIPTLELRRKAKKGIWRYINRVWRRKHKVKTLYLWVAETFAQLQMMSHVVPLTHDNIQKPKNMPFIFALQGGWTIPKRDLRTLTHGPLLSETGDLLVKGGGRLSFYWNKLWPIIAGVATIGGLVRFVAWLFGGR